MNRTSLTSRSPLLLLAAAIAATALASGCASRQAVSYSQPRPHDPFDEAGDRPPTPTTLLAMARILASQGREDESRAVLERILRTDPAFAPASNALAEHHLRSGRLDEGIRVLERALAHRPEDAVLLNNLGMCRMLRTDFAQALDHFTDAVTLAPTDARYRANMAAALGMSGRDDEALALYQQLLPPEEAAQNVALLARAREASGVPQFQSPRARRN